MALWKDEGGGMKAEARRQSESGRPSQAEQRGIGCPLNSAGRSGGEESPLPLGAGLAGNEIPRALRRSE